MAYGHHVAHRIRVHAHGSVPMVTVLCLTTLRAARALLILEGTLRKSTYNKSEL